MGAAVEWHRACDPDGLGEARSERALAGGVTDARANPVPANTGRARARKRSCNSIWSRRLQRRGRRDRRWMRLELLLSGDLAGWRR